MIRSTYTKLHGNLATSIPARFSQCFLLLLLIQSPICEASRSQCYRPNQSLIPGDKPCDPSQSDTFCCGLGWACLENRLCAPTIHMDSDLAKVFPGRGSCTDPSWKAGQCPNFCFDGPDEMNGGARMIQCSDHSYCCLQDKNCSCERGTGTISFEAAPITFTIIGVPPIETTSNPQVNSQISQPILSSTPGATTSSAEPQQTKNSQPTSNSSTSSVSAASPNAATPSQQPASRSKGGTTDKTNTIIGVSLGLLLVAAITAFAFWRERRFKKHMKELRSRWVPHDYYNNIPSPDGTNPAGGDIIQPMRTAFVSVPAGQRCNLVVVVELGADRRSAAELIG